MKIFLFQTEEFQTNAGDNLGKLLSRFGVQLLDREDDSMDFERIDAVIIYGGDTKKDVAFVIAMALAKKKPILYLLPKGAEIDPTLAGLRNDKSMSKYFSFAYVTSSSIEKHLLDFITAGEKEGMHEVPSIKFTLRLTPAMDRYLQWKSKQIGMSKADFLRHVVLEDVMKKDSDYRRG